MSKDKPKKTEKKPVKTTKKAAIKTVISKDK